MRYEKTLQSVRKAVELAAVWSASARIQGLHQAQHRILVHQRPFPKLGRLHHQRVSRPGGLLKERGVDDSPSARACGPTAPATRRPPATLRDPGLPSSSWSATGPGGETYRRPFDRLTWATGWVLNFNRDILQSDFVVLCRCSRPMPRPW